MLIHVTKGQITIRVNDEEINFNIKVAMKHPLHLDYCFKANIVDQVVQQTMELINSIIWYTTWSTISALMLYLVAEKWERKGRMKLFLLFGIYF